MGVPLSREKSSTLVMSWVLILRAHPKSAILMTRPLVMRMFSGLRSRWKTPLTFIEMKAWTICLNILRISLIVRLFSLFL